MDTGEGCGDVFPIFNWPLCCLYFAGCAPVFLKKMFLIKWFVLGQGNMNVRPDTELTLKIIKEFLCPQPHFIPPVSWWASSSTAAFPSSSSFSLRRFTLCPRASPAVWSPSSAISSQACSFSFSPSTSQVNYTHRVGLTPKISTHWMFQSTTNRFFFFLFRSQVVSVLNMNFSLLYGFLIALLNSLC